MRRFEQEAIVNEVMHGVNERIDNSMFVANKQKDYKAMKEIAMWYKDCSQVKSRIADKLAIALLIPYDQERLKSIIKSISDQVSL